MRTAFVTMVMRCDVQPGDGTAGIWGVGLRVSGVPGECQDFADDAPHAPRPF